MPETYLIVVNPAARHGVTGTLLPTIESLLDGQIEYQVSLTTCAGDAETHAAAAEEFDVVVAVGGDGTVHEVLNGLMRIPADRRPALGLLPTGSGNDYRRTLGVSTDLATAVRQLINGKRAWIDLGKVNGVFFANSVAVGLDARVTAKAAELKITTGWSGILLYLRALLIVLFRHFRTHPMSIQIDDRPASEEDLLCVAVTIGPTYGGGFKITPDADAHDGLLDVCTIGKISLAGALWRLPFVIFGKHGWMRPVRLERHTSITLESDLPVEGQVDGEVALASRYEISIRPGALQVVIPDRW